MNFKTTFDRYCIYHLSCSIVYLILFITKPVISLG